MSRQYLEFRTGNGVRQTVVEGVLIGRARDCGLRLDSSLVSRAHARVSRDTAGWWIEDQGSTNGTRIDGELIATRTPLRVGATVVLGDQTLRVIAIGGERAQSRSVRSQRPSAQAPAPHVRPTAKGAVRLTDATAAHPVALASGALSIGRDASNDIVISDRNVSRFHAQLQVNGSRRILQDLGSCNGTRLDGRPIDRAVVSAGSEIGIGRFRLVLSLTEVRTETRSGRLDAHGVCRRVKGGRYVLHRTDLRIVPGEFVGLIGEAGSGKSTLLKILAGVTRPSAGSVSLDGEDLSLRLPDVGYVPQADILQPGLSARESLTYGAKLRLPPDTRPREIKAVVERVLHDLELQPYADTRIGSGLSGGQQRRVAVGMELLGSPRILFLDEPGASLDVRLERRLLQMLRNISESGCAVLTITHRTSSFDRFDRLLVMGRGGILRFDGRPQDALRYFRAPDFDAIYDRLADLPVSVENGRRSPSVAQRASSSASVPPARPGRVQPKPAFAHQLHVLAARTVRVLSRDYRNLGLLVLQAPLLGAGAALLFGAGAFVSTAGEANRSVQLLFALVVIATWMGVIDSARALISERAVFVRERALGVRVAPYLTSKLLVLGALALIQVVLLSAVSFTLVPLHRGMGTYVIVVTLLVLATQAALAMGLLLSGLVSTADQAGSLLPPLLVPQVLCAGAIVTVTEMGPIKPLSVFISSRWALAGVGSALKLATRPYANASFLHSYGGFFSLPWAVSAIILIGFLCLFVSLAAWRLHTAWRG